MRPRRRPKKRFIKRFTGGLIRLFLLILIGVFLLGKVKDLSTSLLTKGNWTPKNLVEGDTKDQLKAMTRQDRRIKTILNNYEDYPEKLLEMLVRNIDMLDFVLDYPSEKGVVHADRIGDLARGEMPLLLQYDQRWGYGNYGDDILAITGCGPTSLAMVIGKLKGDNELTPYKLAQYAEENGYYAEGTGTSWTFFTEGSQDFGVSGKELPLSKGAIYQALESGSPIISSMRPGDFTTTGHMIVLGGIKDGKILVYDPNSRERSSKLWDYERLEGQIRNLWAFDIIK